MSCGTSSMLSGKGNSRLVVFFATDESDLRFAIAFNQF
jgi:hypothetical protein